MAADGTKRRPPDRTGKPMSEKALAALAAGREKKATVLAEWKLGPRGDKPRERLAKLVSGEITYKDLTDEELDRCQLQNARGGFEGTDKLGIPSNVSRGMRQELLRRAQHSMEKAIPKAVERLVGLVDNPLTEDKDAIRAVSILMDRVLGRVPETITVVAEKPWDNVDAVEIVRGEVVHDD